MGEASLLDAFFGACRRGSLVIPVCDSCHCPRWPPRPVCANCGSFDTSMKEVAPGGAIFSWTTVHRAASPAFAERVPYIVGVVELDAVPSVRMLGGVDGVAPEQISVGMRVTAVFRDSGDGVVRPWWRPTEGPRADGLR
jgi:uncharacterized OB-fold protein